MFFGRALLVLGIVTQAVAAGDANVDFFEKKIRPVFVEHCYSCHSTDAKKQRGGLLLDNKAAVLKGGDTGPALVPHKPKESRIIQALRYDDAELRMPPKGKLPDAVIADFEKWVGLGAPDPRVGGGQSAHKYRTIEEGRKFWAFQPPKMPPVPEVKDRAWPNNDIDRFILAKLEDKRLRPARDAEPAVLLRRLYFVLIGLPPTPEEIDEFLRDCEVSKRNDQSNSSNRNARMQAAVVKVVDRLLASPHFGERWGRHWLDVARFA